MPYANFSMFGSALCEVAGVPFPKLEPELNGLLAFHLMLRDVAVNLVHLEAAGNDEAHMLVMFGIAPHDQELEVLRTLGDANFAMMASGSAVLCRQPDTGEIVLRKSVSLSLVEAGDAFKAIVQLAELARQWRVNPMLAQLDAGSTLVRPQQMA